MIINHEHYGYTHKWRDDNVNRYNGAFYYSQEICKYMIPNIKTDRHWVTVNADLGADHAIVFIHNNLHPQRYDYLQRYEDLILVCGIPETMEKVAHLGTPIYLPLSVKVSDVVKYRTAKTKDTAFVGRKVKRENIELPDNIDYLENLPRTTLLKKMAEYKKIYAVGRTAIEGKILGCEILPYDPRFPEDRWEIVDTMDAVKILQERLNEVDNGNAI